MLLFAVKPEGALKQPTEDNLKEKIRAKREKIMKRTTCTV